MGPAPRLDAATLVPRLRERPVPTADTVVVADRLPRVAPVPAAPCQVTKGDGTGVDAFETDLERPPSLPVDGRPCPARLVARGTDSCTVFPLKDTNYFEGQGCACYCRGPCRWPRWRAAFFSDTSTCRAGKNAAFDGEGGAADVAGSAASYGRPNGASVSAGRRLAYACGRAGWALLHDKTTSMFGKTRNAGRRSRQRGSTTGVT